MSISRRLDKEEVVHMYNVILLRNKNTNLTIGKTWINLEGIMLSEINLTEVDNYHMISLICEI